MRRDVTTTDDRANATALVRDDSSKPPTRRWALTLKPDEALTEVVNQGGFAEHASEDEDVRSRLGHDGTFFYERAEDGGLLLWRRPDRNWAFQLAGIVQPVPYPDMLHLDARRTPDGSEVTATWRPHPATKKSSWMLLASALVLLIMLPLYGAAMVWMLPIPALLAPPALASEPIGRPVAHCSQPPTPRWPRTSSGRRARHFVPIATALDRRESFTRPG